MRPSLFARIVPALALSGSCAPPPPPAAPAPPPRPPYSAAQLASAVELEDLAVSPDGSEMAYTGDASGAFELWTLALGRSPVQRTHLGEHVSGLAYSPDGSMLVFESDHGGDERPDLWLWRRDATEPEPLTHTPQAERHARFSPDGKSIVFEQDGPTEFRFTVAVMDLKSRRITYRAPEIDKEENLSSPLFDRSGRWIAATLSPDDQRGELLLLDWKGRSPPLRVPPPRAGGMILPADPLDEQSLLALANNEAGFLQLARVSLASRSASFLGPPDHDVEQARAGDRGNVAFARNVRGASEVSFASGLAPPFEPRVLFGDGVVVKLAVDHDARHLFVIREESDHSGDIVEITSRSGGLDETLAPEMPGIAFGSLARARLRAFPSFDGRSIDALVTTPRVSRLGSPPPLVVLVHGGPNGQARPGFYPNVQALAEAGFVVAQPNYRGSVGYGRAFEDLNNKDWGGGDLKDVDAVVDGLAARGEIDPKRVGITGGSYGGYLTLRAITAEPKRWKAAVEGYGMADLELDYRLTADRFGGWYQTEMGTPEKDPVLFRERSPIHWLDRIEAPLLVLQGANDTNVPKSEGDQIVAALRARRHPVEYVVYPDEGHEFFKRKNRVDALTRTVDFFVRYLGD